MDSLWVLLPAGQRASGEWIDDTLRARAEEKGLLARTPRAGDFPRQRVELIRDADPGAAVNRLYRERGWTDGLPIVPPTLARVDDMLGAGPLERHAVLGDVEPLGGVASVEKIAVNAVMAGCEPAHFPVVLAAVQAILDPAFNLRGVQTTDENVAPLLIVNGPAAARLGVNAGWGALGPGWPANAAIGRAVRLVMTNLGGGWPGAVSFAGLGQPARYSLCLAEREDGSPWPPLHVEQGYGREQSTVTVLRAETVINVTGGLDELASVMGSAASLFGILHGGMPGVILSPFTARRLAGEGWTRADVRRELHARGRLAAETWRRSWLHATVRASDWPEWARAAAEAGSIPAVREPDDITLIVAGADLPIPQHAYCPSWGHPPCRVTREIVLPPTGA
ncbi:MAG TPA: hypothetical protein VFR53_11615 [Methylomirabilota bacterium]|nr:hypothetical protein [Methylomirabilota bacterium]